jgi:RNA polymerase sigma-70 factor (ECF subfamily)
MEEEPGIPRLDHGHVRIEEASMGSLPERINIQVKTADPAETREQELLRRVRAGEKQLFYEVVKPYERRVYSAALAVLRNEADAEDAAQEAILKAFTHIRQFRAEARFSTWLIQIAVNEALMRRRRAHPEIIEPIGERQEEDGQYTPRDFADWREIPSEVLERKEVRQKLADAVATLAQKYRDVFVLRDVQHLSIEETAEALGISRASVKTRLLRARLMLRDLLAPGLGGAWFARLPFEKGSKPW